MTKAPRFIRLFGHTVPGVASGECNVKAEGFTPPPPVGGLDRSPMETWNTADSKLKPRTQTHNSCTACDWLWQFFLHVPFCGRSLLFYVCFFRQFLTCVYSRFVNDVHYFPTVSTVRCFCWLVSKLQLVLVVQVWFVHCCVMSPPRRH